MEAMTRQSPITAHAAISDYGASWRFDAALLLIRIASGVAFLYHGCAILFGSFGGPGISGFAGFTHLPVAMAFLVGLAQFAGGLAILTGVLARLGAACAAIVMLGAIFLVHVPHGFDITRDGMEYALAQLLIAVALVLTGAGRYSLVALVQGSRPTAGESA